ncbi:hypothetical protein Tco_1380384, partial [Tanacetum coccineum]
GFTTSSLGGSDMDGSFRIYILAVIRCTGETESAGAGCSSSSSSSSLSAG